MDCTDPPRTRESERARWFGSADVCCRAETILIKTRSYTHRSTHLVRLHEMSCRRWALGCPLIREKRGQKDQLFVSV